MSCKCDPSWIGNDCICNDSPPLPGGSPRRALNSATCPRGAECREHGSRMANQNKHTEESFGTTISKSMRGDDSFKRAKINIPEICREENEGLKIPDTDCVSLEYRRRAPCAKPLSPKMKSPRCPALGPEIPRPLPPCKDTESFGVKRRKKLVRTGRKNSRLSIECDEGTDVRVPCGYSISDEGQEKGMRKNRLGDCCRPSSQGHTTNLHEKPCASDKRRNMLKSKLRELLREIEPIPESCLLESVESKPEPEILAEVLLMSEAEGIDLADIQPDNVFDNLFSDMSFDRSIAITNAAPESMSDVVVPVEITGQESSSVDMPNSETLIENVRGQVPPNLNAFQQSNVYEQFSGHVSQLLERSPPSHDISDLLGTSSVNRGTNDTQRTEDGILEYVMKPGRPSHVNRIQLNGSMKPNWFPGYSLVSPFIPGYTRMTNDPGDVLKEAWRLCRPQNFGDESITLVNTG